MHELAVTEYVFDLVSKEAKKAGAKKVNKIELIMGDQCDYVPEIIEEYLQVMAEGTPLECAHITASIRESTVSCLDCGANFTRYDFKDSCPKCGSLNLKLNRCTDFLVDKIEIEE